MKLQFSAALVAIGPRDANDVHVLKFAGESRLAVDLHANTVFARGFAGHFGQADAVRITFEADEPSPCETNTCTKIDAPQLEAFDEGVLSERTAIIAWLRAAALYGAAQLIECGEHRKVSE